MHFPGSRSLRKDPSLVIGAILLVLTLFAPPAPVFADRILILHTNDVHSHLESFDDFRAGTHHPGSGGVARRSTLIREQRARGIPTLLMDAGDVFQGTPYFAFYHGRLDYQLMT